MLGSASIACSRALTGGGRRVTPPPAKRAASPSGLVLAYAVHQSGRREAQWLATGTRIRKANPAARSRDAAGSAPGPHSWRGDPQRPAVGGPSTEPNPSGPSGRCPDRLAARHEHHRSRGRSVAFSGRRARGPASARRRPRRSGPRSPQAPAPRAPRPRAAADRVACACRRVRGRPVRRCLPPALGRPASRLTGAPGHRERAPGLVDSRADRRRRPDPCGRFRFAPKARLG